MIIQCFIFLHINIKLFKFGTCTLFINFRKSCYSQKYKICWYMHMSIQNRETLLQVNHHWWNRSIYILLSILNCLIRSRNCLLFTSTRFFGEVRVAHLFSFLYCVFLFFFCLRLYPVPNVVSVSGLSILDCPFSFFLTFIETKVTGEME